jgi:hypothetical protein
MFIIKIPARARSTAKKGVRGPEGSIDYRQPAAALEPKKRILG